MSDDTTRTDGSLEEQDLDEVAGGAGIDRLVRAGRLEAEQAHEDAQAIHDEIEERRRQQSVRDAKDALEEYLKG